MRAAGLSLYDEFGTSDAAMLFDGTITMFSTQALKHGHEQIFCEQFTCVGFAVFVLLQALRLKENNGWFEAFASFSVQVVTLLTSSRVDAFGFMSKSPT